jgi:hypothetical protein
MRAGTLAILLVQVSCQTWNRMVDSNSNTLRDVMKADISLGNSGASNCWTDRSRMLLVICRMALYTEVTYYNAGS